LSNEYQNAGNVTYDWSRRLDDSTQGNVKIVVLASLIGWRFLDECYLKQPPRFLPCLISSGIRSDTFAMATHATVSAAP
jgi:hypothetical protein